MKCRWHGILLSLIIVLSARAQLPEAPIEAMIEVGNQTPFEKETFLITLKIITRGIEIQQQLDLANLPDAGRISIISSFEAIPVERDINGNLSIETRRYRARARGLVSGPTSIAPILRLKVRRRVRSFFGNVIEEQPLSIEISPVTVNVQPLPRPPDDFSGAIGRFHVDISVAPTNLVAGDLVTVSTQISGEGYLDELSIPAVVDAPLLKTYPVKEVQHESRRRRFAQTVIPKSNAVTEISPLQLISFDTGVGRYVTNTFGPFLLQYQEARPRVVEQYRPVEQTPDHARDSQSSPTARLKQRLTASPGVSTSVALETTARLAPSFASQTTFSVPAEGAVQVRDQYGEWSLIEHRRNRGLIHESALILKKKLN